MQNGTILAFLQVVIKQNRDYCLIPYRTYLSQYVLQRELNKTAILFNNCRIFTAHRCHALGGEVPSRHYDAEHHYSMINSKRQARRQCRRVRGCCCRPGRVPDGARRMRRRGRFRADLPGGPPGKKWYARGPPYRPADRRRPACAVLGAASGSWWWRRLAAICRCAARRRAVGLAVASAGGPFVGGAALRGRVACAPAALRRNGCSSVLVAWSRGRPPAVPAAVGRRASLRPVPGPSCRPGLWLCGGLSLPGRAGWAGPVWAAAGRCLIGLRLGA